MRVWVVCVGGGGRGVGAGALGRLTLLGAARGPASGCCRCCAHPLTPKHTRACPQVGRLWTSLADFYIRHGMFERARDVYEEGMTSVVTVHDFSLIFDALTQFEESLLTAKMQALGDDAAEEEEVRVRRTLCVCACACAGVRVALGAAVVLLSVSAACCCGNGCWLAYLVFLRNSPGTQGMRASGCCRRSTRGLVCLAFGAEGVAAGFAPPSTHWPLTTPGACLTP